MIEEYGLPPIMKDDHPILDVNYMAKLKEIFKKMKVEIQYMTKLTMDVMKKFTVVPAKDIAQINDFILQMDEAMKTTLDNHIDCITNSKCVLLQRILEIYEKHEIFKTHFQEKSQKDKDILHKKTKLHKRTNEEKDKALKYQRSLEVEEILFNFILYNLRNPKDHGIWKVKNHRPWAINCNLKH